MDDSQRKRIGVCNSLVCGERHLGKTTQCTHDTVVEYFDDFTSSTERICMDCLSYELLDSSGCFKVLNDPEVVLNVDFATFIKYYERVKERYYEN